VARVAKAARVALAGPMALTVLTGPMALTVPTVPTVRLAESGR